mmetsp:Transcript_27343/g.63762  ORF Transcript_27343/g.63762 Transcript_27343/m.63762 type:complete len:308 (-) Transcript_27343:28-951(-)
MESQTVAALLIGLPIAAETTSTMWRVGRRLLLQEFWFILDLCITVATGAVCVAQLGGQDAGLASMVLFFIACGLRFVWQLALPATAGAAAVVRSGTAAAPSVPNNDLEMRRATSSSFRFPLAASRLVTSELLDLVREELPIWCRFADWQLAYAPHVHGISMQTFYRRQALPCVVVAKTDDAIVGGFASEGFHPNRTGFGTSECFIFRASLSTPAPDDLGGQLEVFGATGAPGEPILWGDLEMFGFGGALMFHNDFKYCTSRECPSFGSPPMWGSGCKDEELRDFECWKLLREQDKAAGLSAAPLLSS